MGLNMHLVGWLVLCVVACVVAFYAAGRARGLYHQPKAGAEKTWNSDFDPGAYRAETVLTVHENEPSAGFLPLYGTSSNKFTLVDANSEEAMDFLQGTLMNHDTMISKDQSVWRYNGGRWHRVASRESATQRSAKLRGHHEQNLKRK